MLKRGALKQHEKTEPQSDRKQDVTRNITRVTYILSQHKSVLLPRSTLPLSRPSDECLATLQGEAVLEFDASHSGVKI